MNKRFKVLLLMCFLILGVAIPMKTEAAAASKLKITGHTYPTSLKEGSYFSLRGRITSNYKIKKVTAGIYNSNGSKSYYKCSTNPRSKTYDLSQYVDYKLNFNTLKTGTYLYKVSAKDTSGKTKTLIKKKFKVVSTTSKLKISNPMPSSNFSINSGGYYTIGGKITSNYSITQVTAKVNDASGRTRFSKSTAPKKTSYVIGNDLDNAMSFNSLEAGSYQYIVTAKDSSGKSKTLVKRTMTVANNSGNTGGNGSSGGTGTPSQPDIPSNGAFTVRSTPPPLSNMNYYSLLYNSYFSDGLAPTGRKIGGLYNQGNCTWYAAGRAREILVQAGKYPNIAIFGPDPVGIWNANKEDRAYAYGNVPKVGSLVVFNYNRAGDAHIAVVEAIVNGVPYVSESGYRMGKAKPTADNISFHYGNMYEWGAGRQILGYIYLI